MESPDAEAEIALDTTEREVSDEAGARVEEEDHEVETEEDAETRQLQRAHEQLQHEFEQMRDLVQRKQAEFDNYRKRIDRERHDTVSYANGELVRDILPVLDNLERAVQAAETGQEPPDSEPERELRMRQGLAIIHRQFIDVLKKVGVREVEAEGEDFDPHVHEAVAQFETSEHGEGTVLQVLQKGYFLKERLLRPALVNVAKAPAAETAKSSELNETDEVETDAS